MLPTGVRTPGEIVRQRISPTFQAFRNRLRYRQLLDLTARELEPVLLLLLASAFVVADLF
jgi:hypothetical protein